MLSGQFFSNRMPKSLHISAFHKDSEPHFCTPTAFFYLHFTFILNQAEPFNVRRRRREPGPYVVYSHGSLATGLTYFVRQ